MTGIEDLLSRKLVIFTGKGGVGKSTLAAAFGVLASHRGKKTLLVEIDPRETIPHIFGLGDQPVYSEVELSPPLYYLNIDPLRALQEYISMTLGFARLYEGLFRSRIYQVFVQASPGLKEIVTLGKLWDLEQKGRYDIIILDAPASGHAIPFLSVPWIVISALRGGPIVREAAKIRDFLSDSGKTILNIVTLPEDMAVTEALEMWETVEHMDRIAIGYCLANEVIPEMFTSDDASALASVPAEADHASLLRGLEFLSSRVSIQQRQIARLRRSLPKKKLRLIPLIFTPDIGPDDLRELAGSMEGDR